MLDYIQEIKKRTIYVFIFSSIIFLSILSVSKFIITYLIKFNLITDNITLITISPYENLTIYLNITFFLSLFLIIPFILLQFILFIAPALTEKEKKIAIIIPIVSLILFSLGTLFSLYMITYIIIPFLTDLTTQIGITNNWSINNYLSFIFYTSTMIGITFQFPIILTLLVKLNLITKKQIITYRKHIYIFILIISALITPPDILSLIIVSMPIVILFELTLLFLR